MRRPAAFALVVLAALLLAAAAVSWYARAALVDEREFSARAVAALDDSDVRRALAGRLVGVATRSVAPDALAVRPVLVPVVAALADTAAFRRLFARALAQRHRALRDGETRFAFELPVGDGVVFDTIERFAPRLAAAIPPGLRLPVLRLDPREFELAGARALDDFSGWRWPLLLAALLAATGAALLAGGTRAALVALGLIVSGAGLLVAAAVAGLGEFVVAHAAHAADLADARERGAVRAVWSALFSDLLTAGLLAALCGALVAALAARARPRIDLAGGRRRLSSAATSPAPAARLARAGGLVALGALLVLEPALAGRLVLIAAGLAVVALGISQLPSREAPEPAGEPSASVSPRALAGALAAVLVTTLAVALLVLPGPEPVTFAVVTPANSCNGSAAACGRRLDQVVFPATHNSYAAAEEPGWFFANQRYGIERQLRDGIRGFLIDVHYGAPDPRNGAVRTFLKGEGSSRNKVARELSPEALRTADRLVGRSRVGRPEGERRAYLCHTLCELGAEPFDEQLELFARFLDATPREVVILFVEPYVPVAEIERSLEATGLREQAAEPESGGRLPTLRELIRADTRLVVLAEQDGGARPWYLPGFDLVQDTPLGATTPAELRCGRYRGERGSPLFLVNHWIPPFPPSVSDNARIGGDFLERRLARCKRRRGLLPNLVAVDFYEQSGVVDVAKGLNQ